VTSQTTLLFLHAHPDDESILTGASIAQAKEAGARVIVAFATRGDAGETSADLGNETLGERRETEARAACETLGVDRVLFLEFDDSGMADTDTTSNPSAFCNANLDEVAVRLSMPLLNETIHGVVGYDRNGTYGHPDHIKIHEAAHYVAPVLKAEWVFDATYNREYMQSLRDGGYENIDENFASAANELTHFIEGPSVFAAKLAALLHHESQTPDDFDPASEEMLEQFATQFGTEWYIATPVPPADSADASADFSRFESIFEPAAAWSGSSSV